MIGDAGAGKSTMLELLSGAASRTTGHITQERAAVGNGR